MNQQGWIVKLKNLRRNAPSLWFGAFFAFGVTAPLLIISVLSPWNLTGRSPKAYPHESVIIQIDAGAIEFKNWRASTFIDFPAIHWAKPTKLRRSHPDEFYEGRREQWGFDFMLVKKRRSIFIPIWLLEICFWITLSTVFAVTRKPRST